MRFDWVVNIGNLFTFVGGMITLIALYFAMRMDTAMNAEKLSVLGGRMINLEAEIKKLTEITATLAVQSQRMCNIEDRLSEQGRRLGVMQGTISDWKLEMFKSKDEH